LASIAERPVGIYELGASSFLVSVAGAATSFFGTTFCYFGDSTTAAGYSSGAP